MKTTIICVGTVLAILLTIALVPASSWVLKNQIDILTRPDASGLGNASQGVADTFTPKWLLNPKTYTGVSPAQKLTHALLLGYPNRNAELLRYAESNPNDPLGWAVLVRMTCMIGARDSDYPRHPDALRERQTDEALAIGISATEKGEALEPDNAYFPFMRACFAKEMNRPNDVTKAMADAATKASFNPHVTDEALTIDHALQSARGYRGELIRYSMASTILLPDLAHFKSLARFLNRHGSLSEKRDLIQTAYRIAQGEQTSIGFLVGFAEVRLALRDPEPIDPREQTKLTDAEWSNLASGFDDRLRAAKVTPPVPGTLTVYETFSRLQAASKKYFASIPALFPTTADETSDSANAEEIRIALQAGIPIFALLAVIATALFSTSGWAFSKVKSDVVMGIAPHFVYIPAWFITIWQTMWCDGCSPTPIAGLTIGLVQICLAFLRLPTKASRTMTTLVAAIALCVNSISSVLLNPLGLLSAGACLLFAGAAWLTTDKQRTAWANWAGGLIALASIAIVKLDDTAVLGGVLYLFIQGLIWKTRAGKPSRFESAASIVVFLAGLATVCVFGGWTILTKDPLPGYGVIALTGLILSAVFIGKSITTVRIATCVGLSLFSAAYVLAVGWQIRGNHEMSASKINLVYEADNIRALAGMRR